jgi:hypothetical protein
MEYGETGASSYSKLLTPNWILLTPNSRQQKLFDKYYQCLYYESNVTPVG